MNNNTITQSQLNACELNPLREYAKYIRYIKEEIFNLSLNLYNQSFLGCESVSCGSKDMVDGYNAMHQETYNSIIERVQDFKEIRSAQEELKDIDFDGLNFDDYKNLRDIV